MYKLVDLDGIPRIKLSEDINKVLIPGPKRIYRIFIGDVPSGDVINFSFPEEGILFPKGIFCKTKTNIAAYTLLTDKYLGPGLTAG